MTQANGSKWPSAVSRQPGYLQRRANWMLERDKDHSLPQFAS